MAVPSWFWVLGGASLIVLGLLQLKARPSATEKNALARWLSAGVLWSLICIAVGVMLVLFAVGVLHGPNMNPTAPPTQRLRH